MLSKDLIFHRWQKLSWKLRWILAAYHRGSMFAAGCVGHVRPGVFVWHVFVWHVFVWHVFVWHVFVRSHRSGSLFPGGALPVCRFAPEYRVTSKQDVERLFCNFTIRAEQQQTNHNRSAWLETIDGKRILSDPRLVFVREPGRGYCDRW
jgi:hypothetical protein